MLKSKEQYETLLQNLAEGIIITDLDGIALYLNDQMIKLAGYSKEEIIGKNAFLLLGAKKDKQALNSILNERMLGISNIYEIEHERKNGERWWGRVVASPYKSEKGDIIGTVGAVTDISFQKELEMQKMYVQEKTKRAIQASEYKLRQIINTSLDAIVNMSQDGLVTEWNSQAEKTFSFTREEALGRDMADLIIPEKYREMHKKGLKHFLATGEGPVLNQRIEITAIDKHNRNFPIELSITPIKIKEEYVFSAFIRDITDRKKAENDLIQAKKEADQARMAEHQFLANMSHEIRTPMNSVIGMTHLLYEAKPSPTQIEYLDALKFSADSLMGIISNILDLSKIEAGELEFEERHFNLRELILSLQQTFQFKVKEKPVSVVAEYDPKIENHVIGDDTRLNQILTNLLGNASKFTYEGTIGINVKLLKKQGDTYLIEFNVHDTGIGIDTEKLPLIFENFKQVDVEIHRKFGGTGLGLSIVKQLVKLQDGDIKVSSNKGKGSSFTVTLPFKNSGIRITEVIRPIITEEDHMELFSRTKVLVVEDNKMNQLLITKILKQWNCPFELVENGLIALERSKEKVFDLILMDLHMPEMDGIESCRHIRADKSNLNNETPIIALTAAALLDERNRVYEVGMNDFLTKPFSPKSLESTMVRWLNYEPKVVAPVVADNGRPLVTVDMNYLTEFSSGDHNFIKEMIEMFLENAPKDTAELQSYFDEGNWEMVYKTAHKLKPNLMMMGMLEQEKEAKNIEIMARAEFIEPEKLKEMIDGLTQDIKAAYPLLNEELKKLMVT